MTKLESLTQGLLSKLQWISPCVDSCLSGFLNTNLTEKNKIYSINVEGSDKVTILK